MDEQQFKNRTKRFALKVIDLVQALPNNETARVIGRQLLRSGTSVGANYRAACRGRSTADVIAKLRIVEEEADESIYWIELLLESRLVTPAEMADPLREADELIAMTVASIRTLQRNSNISAVGRKLQIEKER